MGAPLVLLGKLEKPDGTTEDICLSGNLIFVFVEKKQGTGLKRVDLNVDTIISKAYDLGVFDPLYFQRRTGLTVMTFHHLTGLSEHYSRNFYERKSVHKRHRLNKIVERKILHVYSLQFYLKGKEATWNSDGTWTTETLRNKGSELSKLGLRLGLR